MAGGFFKHLHSIITSLVDVQVLQAAGFSLSNDRDGLFTFEDDDVAQVHGGFVLSLLKARVKRNLWLLLGWPTPFVKMLHGGCAKQVVVNDFHSDYNAFSELSHLANKPKELQDILSRSVFQLVSTLQWVAACQELNWEYGQPMEKLASDTCRGVWSSQIVEDCFAMMKNHKQVKGSRKMRKPESSMGVCLTSGAVDARHKYELLPSDVPVFQRSLRLAKDSFGGTGIPQSTFDTSGITSTSASPSWHSPKADRIGVSAADLIVLRHSLTGCCWA